MITLDRFFDRYDRMVPCWLSDVLVPALILVPLLYLVRLVF